MKSVSHDQQQVVRDTAQRLCSNHQAITLVTIGILAIVGAFFWLIATLRIIIALLILFYLLFVGLKFVLHICSRAYRPVSGQASLDAGLPTYTALVCLYHEANMIPSLVASIEALHYPKDRLQIILLLEDDDTGTQAAIQRAGLPSYFDVVVLPDSLPKGKPKALDVGLARATGEFLVIYDAEDQPDPDQLLKAVAAFRASDDQVACVQARLYFNNSTHGMVSALYWMEYIVHYEDVLPGLTKLGLIPPLGGTSNHFRTAALKHIALPANRLPNGIDMIGGWDPWNVTEDAELSAALALFGYQVTMIDSVTIETAPTHLKVAIRQKSRWTKGYFQTALVYTRRPYQTARLMGVRRWFTYILFVFGTPFSLWINPIFWALTVAYFVTRSAFIEALFPTPIFYTGIGLAILGNLLLFYQLLAAAPRHGIIGNVPWTLLIPFWWICLSWSAYIAFHEVLSQKTRSQWRKTPHEPSEPNREPVPRLGPVPTL